MQFLLNKFRKIFFIVIIIIVAIVAILFLLSYKSLPEGSIRKFNRNYEPISSPIKIGGKMPSGPGGSTFGPILEIPNNQKFYIDIVQSNLWCSNDSCGLDGAIIQTIGGWIEVYDISQIEIDAMFGLDLPENKWVKSIIIIGDKNGKILGIYPNKDYKDALSILKKNHSNLANFDFLNGQNEFGKLKVGEYAPLKYGDNISNLFSSNVIFTENTIPSNKKFYLFGIQKRKNIILGIDKINKVSPKQREEMNAYICSSVGCKYPEPTTPDDPLFSQTEELGGWFLANDNDNIKMIELFGLNPQEVLSGKTSLVVLTDTQGKIIALHPGKTLSDSITILSQHPELVDIKKLYP